MLQTMREGAMPNRHAAVSSQQVMVGSVTCCRHRLIILLVQVVRLPGHLHCLGSLLQYLQDLHITTIPFWPRLNCSWHQPCSCLHNSQRQPKMQCQCASCITHGSLLPKAGVS